MIDSTQHCPGLQAHKTLKSMIVKCDSCGTEKEIFSDELDRPQKCDNCGTALDVKKGRIDAQAGGVAP
jgi:ribosomal protein S27E